MPIDSAGYNYFLRDQLGNPRMVITEDYNVASPIMEVNSYYPFGLQQNGIGLIAAGTLHNYKNTFRSRSSMSFWAWICMSSNTVWVIPQIGRFWQVDPLADKYTYNSTYAFSENKIINAIELEGLESKDVQRRIDLL